MSAPLISVICPCYNEEKHIRHILDFFLSASPKEKELLLIDGMSTDNTRAIIFEYAKEHPEIRLIDNPERIVPFGLNRGIQAARGAYIARLDAHTEYPADYFEQCLAVSRETGADNVGGAITSIATSSSGFAIAHAMSTPFGVGNTSFRTERIDGYVDTVPFGFWKKEAFEQFGLFDTDLKRNQDDEFNYRTIAKGGKIYISQKIHSTYYVRDSFKALFRQYYQYGVYKPLVFKKLNASGVQIRHLIPMAFVAYVITLPLALVWPWYLLPLAAYLGLASRYASQAEGLLVQVKSVWAFILLHMAYGSGFWVGLFTYGLPKKSKA